jgi:hypothetical protein
MNFMDSEMLNSHVNAKQRKLLFLELVINTVIS